MARRKDEDAIFRARQAQEGKKGGVETYKRYGRDFYVKMAQARWAKKKNARNAK